MKGAKDKAICNEKFEGKNQKLGFVNNHREQTKKSRCVEVKKNQVVNEHNGRFKEEHLNKKDFFYYSNYIIIIIVIVIVVILFELNKKWIKNLFKYNVLKIKPLNKECQVVDGHI